MRVLVVALILAAVASAAISWSSHRQDVPFDPGPADALQVLNVYDLPNHGYEDLHGDDARMWLGIAIAFAVSAGGVGIVDARERRKRRDARPA